MTSNTRGNLKALAYCAILVGVLVAIWGVPKLLEQDDEPVVIAEVTETTTTAAPTTTVRRPVSIPTTSARPTLSADNRYLLQLDPEVRAGNTQADLIALGHNICGELDTGSTKPEVARILIDSGFLLSQSMEIIDAAESAYCP